MYVEFIPHSLLLIILLIKIEDDAHTIQESLSVEAWLDGWEQLFFGSSECYLQQLFNLLIPIPFLKVIDDANMINHGSILWNENITAKLVKSLPFKSFLATFDRVTRNGLCFNLAWFEGWALPRSRVKLICKLLIQSMALRQRQRLFQVFHYQKQRIVHDFQFVKELRIFF